jgi:hypothetical protein
MTDVSKRDLMSRRVAAAKGLLSKRNLDVARHRGDPRLAELRREVPGLIGLNANW